MTYEWFPCQRFLIKRCNIHSCLSGDGVWRRQSDAGLSAGSVPSCGHRGSVNGKTRWDWCREFNKEDLCANMAALEHTSGVQKGGPCEFCVGAGSGPADGDPSLYNLTHLTGSSERQSAFRTKAPS